MSQIDYEALIYLTAECNYGGRVTDDKDRRLIVQMLRDFYNHSMVHDEGYKFVENAVYQFKPKLGTHESMVEFFQKFPAISLPGVFGLHANADISKDIGESNLLFDTLMLCGGGGGSEGSGKQDEQLKQIVESIQHGFPEEFNVEHASKLYPVKYEDSMNTVLTQELKRFNVLLALIAASLKEMDKALQGLVMMSHQLEVAAGALLDGKVPQLWRDKSYESSKPVGAYIADLKRRCAFFQKWIDEGHPASYWISGFFFTHSFTTGITQNVARKHKIPIDLLTFDFEVHEQDIDAAPAEGAFVYGMSLEAARWNAEERCLEESLPKQLYSGCPVIKLIPKLQKDLVQFNHYECPLYLTLGRRGILTTSGHNSNFVMYIKLATKKDAAHWIKRGVALFT